MKKIKLEINARASKRKMETKSSHDLCDSMHNLGVYACHKVNKELRDKICGSGEMQQESLALSLGRGLVRCTPLLTIL